MAEITIAIATGPSGGLSLEGEIRLAKPALLYADAVTLISPAAALLKASHEVGADEALTMALVRQVSPALDPQAGEAFALYDRLTRKPRPTRVDRRKSAEFRKLMAESAGEIYATTRQMLTDAGSDELLPAVQAGLLRVDPVVRGDDEAVAAVVSSVMKAMGVEAAYDSLIAESFMSRLRDLLANPSTYPLFDEMVGDVVRAHVAEGLFEVRRTARRRGKQVGVASQFMQGLPSFPAASIAEILDIREELRKPLTNFRAAVAEIERFSHLRLMPNFARRLRISTSRRLHRPSKRSSSLFATTVISDNS